MRIAFVCSDELTMGNLGVEYLAAILKAHGHQVDVVVDSEFNSRPEISKVERENLLELKRLKPDIIGFSVVTPRYQWYLKMARLIKNELQAPTIFGGHHPTAVPEVVIENDCVDMVCVGEGEYAMLELINSMEKGEKRFDIQNIFFKLDGKVVKNDIRPLIQDLDNLPFPDKDIWKGRLHPSYYDNYSIITRRGCAFGCTFCSNNYLRKICHRKGKYLRRRSVDNVIDELVQAKKKYPLRRVVIVDDHFTDDKQWLEGFVQRYKAEIKLPFNCLTHINFMDRERALLLKEAGCWLLMLGIQTGSEYLRRKILNRHETNDQARRIAKICHETGLRFSIDHIFDLPFDKYEYLIESLRLYNEMRPSMINTYRLLYLPKTDIIQTGRNAGIVTDNIYENILVGLYSETIRAPYNPNYWKFHILFTMLPILPKALVRRIADSRRFLSLLNLIPPQVQPIIKIALYIRCGSSYVVSERLRNLPRIILARLRRTLQRAREISSKND